MVTLRVTHYSTIAIDSKMPPSNNKRSNRPLGPMTGAGSMNTIIPPLTTMSPPPRPGLPPTKLPINWPREAQQARQLDLRIDGAWKHVEKTLGWIGRWPDSQTMLEECREKACKDGYAALERPWSTMEMNTVGRLKGWGVPEYVIGVLVGLPSKLLTADQVRDVQFCVRDEAHILQKVHGIGGRP
ncbi:hypothetical protein F66182_5867 [Fusarium sp. NRRL 66182]|nr:hypothetical protein F66182_5867 [Fusarium sp. NRRL 66182]